MEDLSKDKNPDNETIVSDNKYSGTYFLILLLKYKWFIIIMLVIASVSSVLYALSLPNWYAASVNTVPSKNQGSVFENMLGGGISSALKEFGMTKLGGSSGDAYDFIVLMQSRTVKDSIINNFNLAEDYEIPDTMRTKLYDALDDDMDITYEKAGNYTITIQSKDKYKAVEMVNYTIKFVNDLAQRIAHLEASYNKNYLEHRIQQIDSVLKVITDSLSKYSKKNFLFSAEEQAKSISSAYADLKAELIKQETVYEMLSGRLGDNDPYTKMQYELVKNLRRKVEEAKTQPGFAGNFSLEDATEIGIEYMRLYAEFETHTKVKSLIMPMLEDARIEESRKTNTLIVVDPAIPADKKVKPKRSFMVLGFVFGTFILCAIFIVFFDGLKSFKAKYKLLKNN